MDAYRRGSPPTSPTNVTKPTEVLVAAGLLDPMVDHSREAISRAAERLLDLPARDDNCLARDERGPPLLR